MQIFMRILQILVLIFSANSYATIKCNEPKLSKPVEHNSIFHFKTVVECSITGEKINVTALKDAYLAEITDKHSQFKVHKQQDYDNNKGMKGYLLDLTQSYNTPHGPLSVRADFYLLDDNSKNFFLELKSRYVHGEDDAEYDKSIFNQINLTVDGNNATLTSIKEVDVEEPWYAPNSMFFNTVETELMDASRKAALLNARKIIGEKVEALRK